MNWNWPAGFVQSTSQSLFEYSTSATPDPRLLPPAVFVGDSFLDGMQRAGLVAHFVETHRVRWKPALKISTIVENLPPDTRWLVVQFIEVSQTAIAAFASKDDIDVAVKILQSRKAVDASP